jgi:hypothetical protein
MSAAAETYFSRFSSLQAKLACKGVLSSSWDSSDSDFGVLIDEDEALPNMLLLRKEEAYCFSVSSMTKLIFFD